MALPVGTRPRDGLHPGRHGALTSGEPGSTLREVGIEDRDEIEPAATEVADVVGPAHEDLALGSGRRGASSGPSRLTGIEVQPARPRLHPFAPASSQAEVRGTAHACTDPAPRRRRTEPDPSSERSSPPQAAHAAGLPARPAHGGDARSPASGENTNARRASLERPHQPWGAALRVRASRSRPEATGARSAPPAGRRERRRLRRRTDRREHDRAPLDAAARQGDVAHVVVRRAVLTQAPDATRVRPRSARGRGTGVNTAGRVPTTTSNATGLRIEPGAVPEPLGAAQQRRAPIAERLVAARAPPRASVSPPGTITSARRPGAQARVTAISTTTVASSSGAGRSMNAS